jgi:xanthine dehydrogenase accessory factor
MIVWLDALLAHSGPKILVTVAKVLGSGPREAGAKMLVTAQQSLDTIGGGHLEMRAIEIAREMLALPAGALAAERRLERFALGPSLGQCCGGVVHLAFERIEQDALTYFSCLLQRWRLGQDSQRFVCLDQLNAATLFDTAGTRLLGPDLTAQLASLVDHRAACQLIQDQAGQRWLVDTCLAYKPHLMLFGAGHVGSAIVRALADLPCQVTWIDAREDLFPALLPANVRIEVTDTPEALIASAPAGVSFLVLTHSHVLDQHLSEHILRRDDFSWFGLIGSHTKRVQFERRLRERGIPDQRLEQMVCPIGLPGISGKQPAVIAVAVAAQLLQVWEAIEQQQQQQELSDALTLMTRAVSRQDVLDECH